MDLRTLVGDVNTSLKYQPMWAEAIYGILTNKKTNIQLGIEAKIPYSNKCMKSESAVDVMVEAWIAMKPLVDFAIN